VTESTRPDNFAWLVCYLGAVVAVARALALNAQPAFGSSTKSLLCDSDEAATIGFYNERPGMKASKEGGGLERQKNKSQWRVDLSISPTGERLSGAR
jgi:hypothetical protein